MATDAFGRLRVSEPFTTFNYYPSPLAEQTLDVDVWVKDTTIGADATYNQNSKSIELTLSNNMASSATRTTKMPMEYQPGKSRLIMMSSAMVTPIPTTSVPVYSRVGLFNIDSSSNPTSITEGVWFEVDCSINKIKWCEKVNNNGTPELYQFTDSSWNIDTFNGSGPSGKTLTFNDMSKNILLVIDQEWLGVGRVRCGFNIEGVTYYAHAFTHLHMSNTYTPSPRQRLGYQIFSTGNPSTAYKMKQMCCASMSEGGFFPLGVRNSISTDVSGVDIASNDIHPRVIMALKINNSNSNYKNGIIKIINLSLAYKAGNNSTETMKYTMQLHSDNGRTGGKIGTITGTPNYTSLNNSISSYATNPAALDVTVPGFVLTSGFITANTSVDFASNDYEGLLTRTNITQYDTLYVTAQSATTGKAYGALDFIESM